MHSVPRLDAADGWSVRFGRELNATDDRRHFHQQAARDCRCSKESTSSRFASHADRSTLRISEHSAGRLLDAATTFSRARLAYRDVASSTNRLSLIAAVLPPGVVTTHSLFCLKTMLSGDNQAFLCAMLNSYVANYLVRQVMTTHLGSATVEALRVPKPRYDSPLFEEIVELAHELRTGARRPRPRARSGARGALLRADRRRVLARAGHVSAGRRVGASQRARRISPPRPFELG